MNPEIKSTIMIPAYNVEKFLEETLKSALNQTYKRHYEVLLVNDGSTDDTQGVIEWYQRKYQNIISINQKNSGTATARNILLDNARGEILLGLDADDILHPKALENVIGFFDKFPKINHIYTDQSEIDEDGRVLRERKRKEIHKFSDKLTYHCHFQGHLKAFRKDLIRDLRFDENIKSAVDWDFFLKLFPNANILHIPKVLYFYRLNQEGISFTKREEVIRNSIDLVTQYVKKRNLHRERDFKVVPVNAGENIHYYDHIIGGESIMDSKARNILEKFLRSN